MLLGVIAPRALQWRLERRQTVTTTTYWAPLHLVDPPPRRAGSRVFSRARSIENGVKTALLLAALGGLLVGLGSLFGETGAAAGLVLGLVMVGASYWFSDALALRAARAVPVTEWEAPEYHRIVRELCRDAGLPMPRLYVTPDAQPNAFATGRSPRRAAVAVTRGILEALTWDELKGVLAHELAHVGNRDVLISSVAAAVATGVSFLANLAGWLPFFGRHEDDDGPNPVAALLAVLLAPLAATLLQLALSRNREYEADRTGAALVGDGRALARALVKIERTARQVPMVVDPAQASKYVVSPLTGRGGLVTLFMTHPPTAARVARLLSQDRER